MGTEKSLYYLSLRIESGARLRGFRDWSGEGGGDMRRGWEADGKRWEGSHGNELCSMRRGEGVYIS